MAGTEVISQQAIPHALNAPLMMLLETVEMVNVQQEITPYYPKPPVLYYHAPHAIMLWMVSGGMKPDAL